MKNTNRMIENRLKRAVESSVPNLLPGLLEQMENREGLMEMNSITEEPKVIRLADYGRRAASRWKRAFIPVAAALALIIGGWFIDTAYATRAVIAFDVNPSIELAVNRGERVIRVDPRNPEGEAMVGDMKLKGVDLDVAVNALIGNMVRQGYLNERRNSILITVDSKDRGQGARLQRRLSVEISRILMDHSLPGAVLSQTSRADRHFRELADTYGISPGKAALIEQLVQQDPSIQFADVAGLSINDLNLLIGARHQVLHGVEQVGTASRKDYIGEDQARSIALEHARLGDGEVHALEIELDYEDGRMIYEVEFRAGQKAYDYEIDAKNGRILEFKAKDLNQPVGPTVPEVLIGERRAETIALEHAGLNRQSVRRLQTELERKKNQIRYEVEFEHGDYTYEYEIDAESGRILDIEKKARKGQTAQSTAPATVAFIGGEAALKIAFAHAGLSRDQVTGLEIELKEHRTPPYYEIEFKYGGYEYDYGIHALDGRILEFEKEID